MRLRLRILSLLILVCLLSTSMSGQSMLRQKISVRLNNVNIQEALQIITQKSNVDFSYSNDLIPLDKRVNLHLHNSSVDQVLKQLFANTSIIYKKIGNQITLRKQAQFTKLHLTKKGGKLLIKRPAIRLSQTIRGNLVDQESKTPLIGASVWIAVSAAQIR